MTLALLDCGLTVMFSGVSIRTRFAQHRRPATACRRYACSLCPQVRAGAQAITVPTWHLYPQVPNPIGPAAVCMLLFRSFLLSSDRVLAALGTSLLSQSEALAPLCTSLDELSVSASVGHARLVLLQAAAALFVSLAQQQRSRQLLLQPEVSQGVMTSCLKVGLAWFWVGSMAHTSQLQVHDAAHSKWLRQ